MIYPAFLGQAIPSPWIQIHPKTISSKLFKPKNHTYFWGADGSIRKLIWVKLYPMMFIASCFIKKIIYSHDGSYNPITYISHCIPNYIPRFSWSMFFFFVFCFMELNHIESMTSLCWWWDSMIYSHLVCASVIYKPHLDADTPTQVAGYIRSNYWFPILEVSWNMASPKSSMFFSEFARNHPASEVPSFMDTSILFFFFGWYSGIPCYSHLVPGFLIPWYGPPFDGNIQCYSHLGWRQAPACPGSPRLCWRALPRFRIRLCPVLKGCIWLTVWLMSKKSANYFCSNIYHSV